MLHRSIVFWCGGFHALREGGAEAEARPGKQYRQTSGMLVGACPTQEDDDAIRPCALKRRRSLNRIANH